MDRKAANNKQAGGKGGKRETDLHSDQPVINHDLFCEEVSADRGLVLVAEFFVHILVHQRGLAHANHGDKMRHTEQCKEQLVARCLMTCTRN